MNSRLGRWRHLVVLAMVTLVAMLPGGSVSAGESVEGSDLALVRAATARYHDVARAVADGYVPVSECVELPGVGAMGVHYLNPSLAEDLEIDPQLPEVLVYQPAGSGLRLVAVEYFVVDGDQDLATDGDRPSIFGVPFHGPMPGHAAGMPIHYDRHLWVWRHNPAGIAEDWNPTVTC